MAATLLYGCYENFVENMVLFHDQSTQFIIKCLFIEEIRLFEALYAITDDRLIT